MTQKISSAGTSVNMVPRLMKKVEWRRGMVNIDIGGGRFETATDYLHEQGVHSFVYDPFNRDKEHNRRVYELLVRHGQADTATLSNVLNVIREKRERLRALDIAASALRPGGACYITVYEGNGSGRGKRTTRGFQLNRRLAKYLPEVREVFGNVEVKGKMIIARLQRQEQ